MTYSEKLSDKRWLEKRSVILIRDGFKCLNCGAKNNLQVHHKAYGRGHPWEVPDEWLETLCRDCHRRRTEIDLKFRLKPTAQIFESAPCEVAVSENNCESEGEFCEPTFAEMYPAEPPTCFTCRNFVIDLGICCHGENHKGNDAAFLVSPNDFCELHEFT